LTFFLELIIESGGIIAFQSNSENGREDMKKGPE
jgi:hypothetical protein